MSKRITIPVLLDITKTNKRTITVNKRITVSDNLIVSQTIDVHGKVDKHKCMITTKEDGEYICPISFEEANKLIEDNGTNNIGLIK